VQIKNLLGVLYHENSKLDQFTARQQGETIGYFSDPYIVERSTNPHKKYFGKKRHQFDSELLRENADDFFNLVTRRRSGRNFDPNYKMSLNELEHILYYSYGITRKESINDTGGYMGYRNVPSAGGLYPLEIYVALFNSHVDEGLYHYDDHGNSLVLIKEGHHLEQLRKIIKAEPYIDIASATGVIFITGMIERQAIKYGERSHRFMLQEAGSVAYLTSLITEHMGLGSCWTGAFIDQEVNNFLGIDGNYETVLNPIVFGKKTC